MKKNNPDRVLLGISLAGFLLMSVSFVLMPFETVSIVPGILFWGGLIIGVVFQIVLEKRRRAFFASYNVKREKMQKPHNGLLTFGSNRAAMIADNTLACSFVATILAFVFTKGTGYLCYVFIATTVFTFCLHCILNGRIFFHAKNQAKVRLMLEQKKVSTTDKGEGNNENR